MLVLSNGTKIDEPAEFQVSTKTIPKSDECEGATRVKLWLKQVKMWSNVFVEKCGFSV